MSTALLHPNLLLRPMQPCSYAFTAPLDRQCITAGSLLRCKVLTSAGGGVTGAQACVAGTCWGFKYVMWEAWDKRALAENSRQGEQCSCHEMGYLAATMQRPREVRGPQAKVCPQRLASVHAHQAAAAATCVLLLRRCCASLRLAAAAAAVAAGGRRCRFVRCHPRRLPLHALPHLLGNHQEVAGVPAGVERGEAWAGQGGQVDGWTTVERPTRRAGSGGSTCDAPADQQRRQRQREETGSSGNITPAAAAAAAAAAADKQRHLK